MFASSCPTNCFFVSGFVGKVVKRKHFFLLKALSLWGTWATVIPGSPSLVSVNCGARREPVKRGILQMGKRRHSVAQAKANGHFPPVCIALTSGFPKLAFQQSWWLPGRALMTLSPVKGFPWHWRWSSRSRAGDEQMQAVLWRTVLDPLGFPWYSQLPPATFSLPTVYPLVFFFSSKLVNQCASVSKCLWAEFIGVHKHAKATIKAQKNEYMLMYSVIIKPEKGEKKAMILSLWKE